MKPSERYPHTCPICGKDFIARKDRVFCSHACDAENRRKKVAGKPGERRLARESEAGRRRAFFANLDAAYERNFPGLQSGAVRGRIAAGGLAGVIRDTGTGAIVRRFIARPSEK